MSGRETYDISAKDKRILEFRAARRTQLRHEYLKQIGNPYRPADGVGGTVFDSGIQRFISMRATASEHFRPNPKNALFTLGAVVVPTAVVMYWIIGAKNREEKMLRTGQVSYRDREFKFA